MIDDKVHGKCFEYYKNGQISTEGSFVNGKADGKMLSYFETGQLSSECIYIDDRHMT